MKKEESRVLSSGLTMYSYENPNLNSFYISLFLRAGSMYEREEQSGITHFLEHTLIRNVNAIMNGELYRTLDRYGIEFNASTYSEMVQFYVTGASKNIAVAAEILSRVLSPIILSASELDAERARIKAEMRENDERGSLANFTSGILHSGTSLARSITGNAKTLNSIRKTSLESYRREVCTSENLFLYLTGSFSDSDVEIIDRIFSAYSLPRGQKHENIAPVSRYFGKREPNLYLKNADYTMLRFNFDMDMSAVSVPESDLIYDVLLGGYNSRLFIELSEKRGIFYDISGSSERYRNVGFFSFSFELKPADVTLAVESVLEVISELCEDLLSEDQCMKASYVDNGLMLYDDSRELNFTMAYDNHLLERGYSTLADRAEAYRKVTPERLREVANIIFRPENLILTAKGNKRHFDTEKISELIKSFRSTKQ